MAEYTKPFLPFDEQADLLLERGMQGDREVMVKHLKDVGYYRLSGYWHIFKQSDDTFRRDTTFDKVWDYYVFDRQLRLCVLDAIERVEMWAEWYKRAIPIADARLDERLKRIQGDEKDG